MLVEKAAISVAPHNFRWHIFSWQGIMGYQAVVLFLLFFVTGPVFMATHINIGNVLFVLLVLQLGLHILFVRKLNLGYLIVCLAYLTALLMSLCVTPVVGIPVKYGIQELLYYLKPFFFFLFGYCFLNNKLFERLYLIVLIYMVAGTIGFYLDPMLFIKETLLKIGDVEQQNTGFLYAFSLFMRNTSFLLSALETSFVMFFISYYYYYKSWNERTFNNFILFSFSFVILLSAIARSSFLGLVLAIGVHIFIVARPFKRITLICITTILIAVIAFFFYNQIEFLLFKDNSASIHQENLQTALSQITSSWFLPSGLGSSGWVTAGMPFNIYSEGSIFTSIIENGIMFLLVYGGALYFTLKSSRDYLFPLFLGYLLASLLIPIGFSTLFNLFFFSALGARLCATRLATKDIVHRKDVLHV